MTKANDNQNTWDVAVLNIDWRADRHDESHCIEFERPTTDNPCPEHPVVVDRELSYQRLPMSGSWGSLFASVIVKAFDEHTLTIQYGACEYTLRAGEPWKKLGESGMDYTTFNLYIGLKNVSADEKNAQGSLRITHDGQFLQRFLTKERIARLTADDVALLRQQAAANDAFAQYGLGRWLYCMSPTDQSVREAEELFLASSGRVTDARAAYALMWRYGDTKESRMDIEKSNSLLEEAALWGSELARQQQARFRIFGLFCEAEPDAVVGEIEQKYTRYDDCDPRWHTLLAYAYEQLGRKDEAAEQYEEAIRRGDVDCYYDEAAIYKERGNMALYDSLMEEGISRGSAVCCVYQADMDEEDYQQLPDDEQWLFTEQLSARLERGLAKGNGVCAYYLWVNYYYGMLGFPENELNAIQYLKRGAQLGDVNCIERIAILHFDGEWPEEMSRTERFELWLRSARYLPDGKEALYHLKYANDETFLLRHKEELEKYWKPQWERYVADDSTQEPTPTPKPKTPIDPMVIIIWPTGHMDIEQVDVSKIPSYREMAQQLIGGDGLDAVRNTSLLFTIGEAAELDHPLVMYVDRDAQMKGLPDNAIGTLLYGGGEVRGPIIICQQDERGDCMSFTTVEDLTATYNEIDKHCNGLLIIKDEDDGKYDAYV